MYTTIVPVSSILNSNSIAGPSNTGNSNRFGSNLNLPNQNSVTNTTQPGSSVTRLRPVPSSTAIETAAPINSNISKPYREGNLKYKYDKAYSTNIFLDIQYSSHWQIDRKFIENPQDSFIRKTKDTFLTFQTRIWHSLVHEQLSYDLDFRRRLNQYFRFNGIFVNYDYNTIARALHMFQYTTDIAQHRELAQGLLNARINILNRAFRDKYLNQKEYNRLIEFAEYAYKAHLAFNGITEEKYNELTPKR